MSGLFLPLGAYDPYQVIGVAGFVLYVFTYSSLSFNFITSASATYFVLNTTAASLVLVSLTAEFNLASALIQTFWIAIGICAICIRLRQRWSQSHKAVPGGVHHPIEPLHEIHPRRPREHLHTNVPVANRQPTSHQLS